VNRRLIALEERRLAQTLRVSTYLTAKTTAIWGVPAVCRLGAVLGGIRAIQ
jgi:hypothetical protein